MKKEEKNVCSSIDGANTDNVLIDVVDNTQTKGKATAKFTIVDDAAQIDAFETPDKNKVFQAVNDFLCPVQFEDTAIRNGMQALVNSGILSADVMEAAISKAKKEFLEANSKVIESAQKLSFAEVIDKLQEDKSLFNQMLSVCNVNEFVESNYTDGESVFIYRGAQCYDKEGNERYGREILKKEINGKSFEETVFVEKREVTTDNIVLAIRYYSSKQTAIRRLNNKVSDYKRLLDNVLTSSAKAISNGFSKEQIINAINAL